MRLHEPIPEVMRIFGELILALLWTLWVGFVRLVRWVFRIPD